jgi:hypothetical protein
MLEQKTVHPLLESIDWQPKDQTAPAAAEILDFIALDDELMADLDAVVETDAATLAANVAARDRLADRAGGVEALEALADLTIARAMRAILAEMWREGTPMARDVVPAPGDVYNHVVTAAAEIAGAGSTNEDLDR